MWATPKNRPVRNHFNFANKVDFLLHQVTLRSSPYQQRAKVSYIRESKSHRDTADVICASWWRDHATFINRSATNKDNKGQKSRQNQMMSPKMRICLPPEGAECSACHTNTNYQYGLFVAETSFPHDQFTVVWQTERTLTRLFWSCGCCSEGLVGCFPHPRATTNNHNFTIWNRYGKKISKFKYQSIIISHLPVGLIVKTVVISRISPDR